MQRRLFNIGAGGAVAVSLIVLVVAVLGMVRSRTVFDAIHHKSLKRSTAPNGSGLLASEIFEVASDAGSLTVAHTRLTVPAARAFSAPLVPDPGWRYVCHERPSRPYTLGDFVVSLKGDGGNLDETAVRVPWWSIAVSATVLPLAWLAARSRRNRRRAAGLCPTCNYDCRGPADGTLLPRCPECGTDLAPSTPAANTTSVVDLRD